MIKSGQSLYIFDPKLTTSVQSAGRGRSVELETIASVKLRSRQKEDLRQTFFHIASYVVNFASLFYITLHVLPYRKFFITENFRTNMKMEDKTQINDTWPFLKNELLPFIHLKELYNNEKAILSTLE